MRDSSVKKWAPIVASSFQTHLPVAVVARQHGVSEASLFRWRSRLGPRTAPPAFVEVPLPCAPPAPELRLDLIHLGVSISVPPGSDLAWLRSVVDALC